MKVILLKSVPKIGKKYETLEVAAGYAMNALFPKNLAERATPKALARVEALRLAEDAERQVREDLLLKNIKGINDTKIELSGKANEQGHLFAGIHKDELIAALKEQARLDITAEYIVLEKAIKEVGEHKVTVQVQDATAEFTVVVTASE